MVEVDVRHVSARYDNFTAVEDLSLEIRKSEFFSLLGPSGCGKSTTLRMVAGFVPPSSGQILIKGQNVTALPPEARNIGIVFQNYAIFPHLTVFENIAFGLRMRKLSQPVINQAVGTALEQVGLQGFDMRYQRELSGGEQQRVAVARALINNPAVVLADEPSGNLDSNTAKDLHQLFFTLREKFNQTFVIVTHNEELANMADRKLVMKDGNIL